MRQMPDLIQPLFDEFAAKLGAAGGAAAQVTSLDDLVTMLRQHTAMDPESPIWISRRADEALPGLAGALRDAGIPHALPSSISEIRDAPLGITVAELAIAETGSVLLYEPDLADRSVSLMTQHLVVLCETGSIVPSLDEAAPVLRDIARNGPSYATFVTGPSRTADIERELAVGVQGPGILDVVFLPDPLA